jgi:hypothetical protein
MELETAALERTDAPADRPVETLDVRDLGPPEPLRQTLELLADLPDEAVLVQRNDRAPQFLYPKLDDRGYAHETVETDDAVVTAIWVADGDADVTGGTGDADATDEEGER